MQRAAPAILYRIGVGKLRIERAKADSFRKGRKTLAAMDLSDEASSRPAFQNPCSHGPVGSARHSSCEDRLFASRDFRPATSRRPSCKNARPPNRSAWVASVNSCCPVPRCQRLMMVWTVLARFGVAICSLIQICLALKSQLGD
jgi:hypothetical protein